MTVVLAVGAALRGRARLKAEPVIVVISEKKATLAIWSPSVKIACTESKSKVFLLCIHLGNGRYLTTVLR
jgi:hypothetical protein